LVMQIMVWKYLVVQDCGKIWNKIWYQVFTA
jgi:hypothetical protein